MMRWLLCCLLAIGCGGGKKTPKKPIDGSKVSSLQSELTHLRSDLRLCHERERAIDHRAAGDMVVDVTERNGSARVTLVSNKTGSKRLADCALGVLKGHDWTGILESGARYRTPIAFLPLGPLHTVQLAHASPIRFADGYEMVPLVTQKNSDNKLGSLSLLRLTTETPLEVHEQDELLFVLGGEAMLFDKRGRKKGTRLVPGSAVFVPKGAPHKIRNLVNEPLVAVSSYSPSPDWNGVDSALPGTKDVSDQKKFSRKTPRPKTRKTGFVKPRLILRQQGEVRRMLGKKQKSPSYLGAITLFAGAKVPPHVHDESTELIYIVEGKGRLTVGEEAYDVGPGTAIQIPKGVTHGFENNGGIAVKAVQVYAPRGPEERFKGRR